MSTDLDLRVPDGTAPVAYDDLVAAWHEVDSRSSWFKARLAAAVPLDQLKQFAIDVGVSYATVKNYRSVAEQYPEQIGRPNVSFGVATALMAQPDRAELTARPEPWTVREARGLAAGRAPAADKPRRGRPRKQAAADNSQPAVQPPAEQCSPQDEAAIRADERAQALAQFRDKFEPQWDKAQEKIARRDQRIAELTAECDQLREQLQASPPAPVGTCPAHRIALTPVCPRCQGLEDA